MWQNMVCMVWGKPALWMITRRLPIWTQFWRCFIWKNSETHWTPEEVFWPKLSPTMVKAKPKHWKGSKALSWCIAWAPRFKRAAKHQDPKHYASLCSTWWVLSGYKARMSTNRSNFSKNLAKVCKTQLLLVAMTMLDTGITELLQRGSQHW